MRWFLAVALAVILLASCAPTAQAEEAPAELTADQQAIRAILSQYRSPLPPWTIEAFAGNHPDFDIAGYLAVMMCESSLGTTGGSFRYNNPGNIKFGGWRAADDPKVWLRWMNGSWHCRGQGVYGTFPSMYWGQRAAIRLIYETGYNARLAAHDWWGFANRYYGRTVAGISGYVANLRAAHNRLVKTAALYGAAW
jgi:hypothetical protein